jgi:hypothetical protein
MPRNKDFKRLVRNRMQKTGESYTAARARISHRRKTAETAATPGATHAGIAGMSDEAVRAKTGKTWKQWCRVLDAIDAADMPHRAIAAHLREVHDLPAWWAQMVTVGYERIRGLRDRGQRRNGEYEASKSKTLLLPLPELYRAFSLSRRREKWLPGVKWTVRKAIRDKSMRVTWEDGTSVEIYFTAKGPRKTQVVIQHRKLATRGQTEEAKRYWSERLSELARSVSAR